MVATAATARVVARATTAVAAAAAAVRRVLAEAGPEPQQRLESALQEHLLRDYVDELAGWAVGPGAAAGELIRCWGGVEPHQYAGP